MKTYVYICMSACMHVHLYLCGVQHLRFRLKHGASRFSIILGPGASAWTAPKVGGGGTFSTLDSLISLTGLFAPELDQTESVRAWFRWRQWPRAGVRMLPRTRWGCLMRKFQDNTIPACASLLLCCLSCYQLWYCFLHRAFPSAQQSHLFGITSEIAAASDKLRS